MKIIGVTHRLLKLFPGAVVILSLSACSSLQINPTAGQNVIYSNGQPTVLSVGRVTTAAVQPLGKDQDGRIAFRIAFLNSSKAPFNFGLENVRAADSNGNAVRIYTRHEVERHARVKALWQAIALSASAGAQAGLASAPATTTYGGVYRTPYGGYGSYVGTATSYNPAQTVLAQQAVQANAMASGRMIGGELNNELASAQAILGTTTVFPGQWCSGILLTNKSDRLDIRIDTLGDQHRAAFDLK